MKIVFYLFMLLFSSLATAATPIEGLYGSAFGGMSYIPDNISKFHNGIKFEDAVFHNGFHVGGRIGYLANYWRYEGELSYMRVTLGSFRYGVPPFFFGKRKANDATGQENMVIGLANLYYDFPEIVPCVSPFLGAGVGYGWFNANFSNRLFGHGSSFLNPNFFIRPTILNPIFFQNPLYNPFFQNIHYSGSSTGFVFQGTAGFTFNFAENWALNLAYRYVGSSKISAYGKVLQANLASVGVVYRFNGYNYI